MIPDLKAPTSDPQPRDVVESKAALTKTRGRRRIAPAPLLILGLLLLHSWAIWVASGGWAAISSDWPIAQHDHPLQFHSMVVSGAFFRQSGTNAGYDPSFMAGFPKTLLFPQSAAIFDVVGLLSGGSSPAQTFKLFVFASTASLPWLIALAAWLLGMRARAIAWSVAAALLYVWTEGGGAGFPLNYAMFGMLPYWLAIPLGLVATLAVSRFLSLGGALRWLASAGLLSLTWLSHVTSPMILAPACGLAYIVAIVEGRRRGRPIRWRRHLLFWGLPILVLLTNAFWWWPSLWYRSMLSKELPAFVHPEPVWGRLLEVVSWSPPIQVVLLALLAPGLIVLARRDRVAASALGGFAAAGFAWGYLAGAFRALDMLQPGRQTYALYLASTLAAGLAIQELLERLRPGRGRLDLWLVLALILVSLRIFGPGVLGSARSRLGFDGSQPFLSSQPDDRLRWVVDQVRSGMEPGERLLYEEGGDEPPGTLDPYQGGRYSGLLPTLTGVEVLGGPYLKVTLQTNFTQFSGQRLFGQKDWDEDDFRTYAEIYRPEAILCWSPRALEFCRSNPDLIEIQGVHVLELPVFDPETGRGSWVRSELLFGRIKGFEGATVRGQARVRAEPGRLHIESAQGDELDGLVVLRYHSLPFLKSKPPVRLESVRLADDPVPFIGFRPPPGDFTLELDFPP